MGIMFQLNSNPKVQRERVRDGMAALKAIHMQCIQCQRPLPSNSIDFLYPRQGNSKTTNLKNKNYSKSLSYKSHLHHLSFFFTPLPSLDLLLFLKSYFRILTSFKWGGVQGQGGGGIARS